MASMKTKKNGIDLKVKLNGTADIVEFNKLCSEYTGEVDISLGRYTVDGKSVLGLYSLDLSRELNCHVYESKEENATDTFTESLAKFAV